MLKCFAIVVTVLFALPAFAAGPPQTEEEKTLYAVGLVISQQISVFSLSPAELEMVKQGMADGTSGQKPAVEMSAYLGKVQDLAKARRKAKGDQLGGLNKEFLEKAAKEKGAVKLESGLIFQSIEDGKGATPGPTDQVTVNYRGTLADGTEFDSSYKRGKPLAFKLDNVIRCWTEGLQKMKEGGKAKLFCPASIAYGETGAGDKILPGAALAFEVELLQVKK
jgi:FKBP-type peptidyl-prolyl cis-trans isomerase FkpA